MSLSLSQLAIHPKVEALQANRMPDEAHLLLHKCQHKHADGGGIDGDVDESREKCKLQNKVNHGRQILQCSAPQGSSNGLKQRLLSSGIE